MPLVRSRPITIVTRIALSCSESDELTTNSAREASLFPEPVLLSNYGSHRIRSYRRQTMESVAIVARRWMAAEATSFVSGPAIAWQR